MPTRGGSKRTSPITLVHTSSSLAKLPSNESWTSLLTCNLLTLLLPTAQSPMRLVKRNPTYVFKAHTAKFPFLFLDYSGLQNSFSLFLITKQLVSTPCIGYLQCLKSLYFCNWSKLMLLFNISYSHILKDNGLLNLSDIFNPFLYYFLILHLE